MNANLFWQFGKQVDASIQYDDSEVNAYGITQTLDITNFISLQSPSMSFDTVNSNSLKESGDKSVYTMNISGAYREWNKIRDFANIVFANRTNQPLLVSISNNSNTIYKGLLPIQQNDKTYNLAVVSNNNSEVLILNDRVSDADGMLFKKTYASVNHQGDGNYNSIEFALGVLVINTNTNKILHSCTLIITYEIF